uniref:Uncharacterized protein n=1 Tax=Romanomermis culicivorax TaxID=13658 RepID=A0A915HMA5_ROMCU
MHLNQDEITILADGLLLGHAAAFKCGIRRNQITVELAARIRLSLASGRLLTPKTLERLVTPKMQKKSIRGHIIKILKGVENKKKNFVSSSNVQKMFEGKNRPMDFVEIICLSQHQEKLMPFLQENNLLHISDISPCARPIIYYTMH